MRDLRELNINRGGKPVDRPPPSEAQLSAFQNYFGVQLPQEYIELLKHSNGGHPELDSAPIQGRPDLPARPVNHFYFLNDDKVDSDSLWLGASTWRVVLGDKYIAFGEDGGGNSFLFDYTSSPPSICTCFHDECNSIRQIAPTFGDFIDSLCIDPEML